MSNASNGKSNKMHTFGNGDGMPLLGLGTWKSVGGDVGRAVREAIRVGYRHIDCAAFYGNEAEIGQALQAAVREGDVAREDLWITSKLWNNAHGRKDVVVALKQSLSDLGLDYLDLYLVHWPIALKPSVSWPSAGTDFASAEEAPLHETWAAMEATRAEGLARHVGVSNFSVKKLKELLAHAKVTPEVNQVELHPFLRQQALVDYCNAQGMHVTGYCTLGSGDRPEFLKAPTDPVPLEHPIIKSIAEAHGATPAQVLLAWHLHRGTSALAKSVSPARLRENFAANELQLSADDLAQIANLDQGFRFIAGKFWEIPGSPWTVENLWDEPQRA